MALHFLRSIKYNDRHVNCFYLFQSSFSCRFVKSAVFNFTTKKYYFSFGRMYLFQFKISRFLDLHIFWISFVLSQWNYPCICLWTQQTKIYNKFGSRKRSLFIEFVPNRFRGEGFTVLRVESCHIRCEQDILCKNKQFMRCQCSWFVFSFFKIYNICIYFKTKPSLSLKEGL